MLDVHRLRLLRELRHRGTLAAVAARWATARRPSPTSSTCSNGATAGRSGCAGADHTVQCTFRPVL